MMNDKRIDLYYSLSSPWAYLGGPRFTDIVARHHASVCLKPYDFQVAVPQTGGIALRTRPLARRNYHALELARWSKYLGMPLNLEPKFYRHDGQPPNWNKQAGWMVIAAQQQGLDAMQLSHAIIKALWADERDIANPEVRVAIGNEVGMNGAALVALEKSAQVQNEYLANTNQAIEVGIFGSPIYVYNTERFWGQDRLDFLDRALALQA
jgi:2-hydroxychromene-2-carboxylate isomerase